MTKLNPKDIMRLRIQALYNFDEQGRMVDINQWDGGQAPRFFLARTLTGNHFCFRSDVPNELAQELSRLCDKEPHTVNPLPKYYELYLDLLESHGPIKVEWQGPAYYYVGKTINPVTPPQRITAENNYLLQKELKDWLADVPHRQPFIAALEGDKAVSVCTSVRISNGVHEAGVETLLEYRRQGHAYNAVAGWINALVEKNILPLYSTSWSNKASQNLAKKLGFTFFGTDFHIT